MDTATTLPLLAGVVMACAGTVLILQSAHEMRKHEVTPREVETWRAHESKQGFSLPENVSLDVAAEFALAWRRQDALRHLAQGIAFLVWGVAFAVVYASNLRSVRLSLEILFLSLWIMPYVAVVMSAYLGISHLSHRQRVSGRPPNQRLLSDYRHPLFPVLFIVFVLGYVALLCVAAIRLAHGLDLALLASLLTLPDIWTLLLRLVVMFAAIGMTEVVARRIVALPSIPFPPASGGEIVADAAIRGEAIEECYFMTGFAIIMTTLIPSRLIARSGLDNWLLAFIALGMFAGIAIFFQSDSRRRRLPLH